MFWSATHGSKGLRDVEGLYRKVNRLQVADESDFKAVTGGRRPLKDQISEHFLSGAGCRKQQLA